MVKIKTEHKYSDDYDSPWKEAIEHYFPEFMEWYFPDAYSAIDWTKPYQFLDQELRTIIPQSRTSKRVVDKLVKVELLDGEERWLYIHFEVQGRRETAFGKRIYTCNYRIFDKYGVPVASFVILTDNDNNWRPTTYGYEFAGSKLLFNFHMVKLLDFKPRMEELLASSNVFGLITAAHLLTQQTRSNREARFAAKLHLIRLLYQRQWSRERIKELFRVIDWFLTLPKELEQQLQAEVYKTEEEQKMQYISSIERYAMEKGKEIGVLEGIEKGKAEGAEQTRLEIARRFVANGISKEQVAEITGVAVELL